MMPINKTDMLESMKNTPVDPAVGIAVVKGVALPGVSLGMAVVVDKIKPHYQKVSDEIYYILKGQGELTVGEETVLLHEGEAASIPKGQVHGFVNTGDEPCLVLFASGP
ncbi:MAG: cupin domain-containing protein, partial [Clostridia bacterium]|nr:cupin domain-containing protein [Clostridia bacterium]